MVSIVRSTLLVLIVAIIAGSSFYRFSNNLYGYTAVFALLSLLGAFGICISHKGSVEAALVRLKNLEIVFFLTLIWLIVLAMPLPINWISFFSPDAAGIRSVWVPTVEKATISLFPYRMLEPILTLITAAILFLTIYLSSTTNNLRYIPITICFVALIQGSLAIHSAMTHHQFIDPRLFDGHFGHGRGTFVNKNLFAAFMWFPVCYAIANLWERAQSLGAQSFTSFIKLKDFHVRLGGWYVLLFFSLIASSSSFSSGAFVVLTILSITILIAFGKTPVEFIRRYSFWIIGAFIFGIAILLLQPGGPALYEHYFGLRATIWYRAVDLLKLYWLTGLGGDGISEMFDLINDWLFILYRANTAHTYIIDQWLKFGLVYVLGITLLWFLIYRNHLAGKNVLWQSINFEGRVFIRFTVLVGYCLLLHSVVSPVFYYVAIHFSFICVLAAACKVVADNALFKV